VEQLQKGCVNKVRIYRPTSTDIGCQRAQVIVGVGIVSPFVAALLLMKTAEIKTKQMRKCRFLPTF
jgi:hypothetical protein